MHVNGTEELPELLTSLWFWPCQIMDWESASSTIMDADQSGFVIDQSLIYQTSLRAFHISHNNLARTPMSRKGVGGSEFGLPSFCM